MLKSERRIGAWLLPAMVGAALAFIADRTDAIEELRYDVATIARVVKQVAASRSGKTVAVGDFSGPAGFRSGAGNGIRKMLIEELQQRGLTVKSGRSDLSVQGRYRVLSRGGNKVASDPNLPEFKQTVVVLEASIEDADGESLLSDKREVQVPYDNPDFVPFDGNRGEIVPIDNGRVRRENDFPSVDGLGRLLGANIDLEQFMVVDPFGRSVLPDDPAAVLTNFDRTSVHISGRSALSASSRSPFQMALLVDGHSVPLTIDERQPFAKLEKGDSFQIWFSNDANYDVAVEFMIDGINTFAFSDLRVRRPDGGTKSKYTRWIIPRRGTMTIKGWHRTNESVDKFLITDFANSAAAKIGASTSAVGTITAVVKATWPLGKPGPSGEPPRYAKMMAQVPQTGVGFGERDRQVVEEDRETRDYGAVRAIMTIRYQKPEE